jgi:hypothetical protein
MELLERVLLRLFPSDDARRQAWKLLQSYGVEKHESEIDRVRLAVLKLSGGDLAKIKAFVTTAKTDPRDVLMWAEYPGEMAHLGLAVKALNNDPEAGVRIREIRDGDRDQYERWLAQFTN